MGRNFGRLPSDLLRIADPTVACAVDTAATLLLTQTDREHGEIVETRRLAAMLGGLVGGGPPSVEWERVEEF